MNRFFCVEVREVRTQWPAAPASAILGEGPTIQAAFEAYQRAGGHIPATKCVFYKGCKIKVEEMIVTTLVEKKCLVEKK